MGIFMANNSCRRGLRLERSHAWENFGIVILCHLPCYKFQSFSDPLLLSECEENKNNNSKCCCLQADLIALLDLQIILINRDLHKLAYSY